MEHEATIKAIARRITASIGVEQWRREMIGRFKSVKPHGNFGDPVIQCSADGRRVSAIYNYKHDETALVALEAVLADTGEWGYQVQWIAGNRQSLNEKGLYYGKDEFDKAKTALLSVSSKVRNLVENSDAYKPEEEGDPVFMHDEDKDERETSTIVNGGWGDVFPHHTTGGAIRPNLQRLDGDGYALEFVFISYLEYDQHFMEGWDEQKIVGELSRFATPTYHRHDFYGFKAKSHDAIRNILQIAKSAGLMIDVPSK